MSAQPCLPYIDSRLRALADGRGALLSHTDVEERRLREAELDVEALEAKLLQAQRDHGAAAEELKSLNDKEGEAVKAIKAAAAAVQRLTRQQLEEVRCLAQPPMVVKRALSLVHALLHPEEISEDDPALISDWDRLSLLLRKSLLQQVASFPPPEHPLAAHPHVRELIASHVEDAELRPDGARRPCGAWPPPRPRAPRSSQRGPATARGARPSHAAVAEAATYAGRPGSAGEGSGGWRPAPLLTVRGVAFACRPVGVLFRWLVQQVRFAEALLLHEESAEREQKQLKGAEAAVRRLGGAIDRLRGEAGEAKARCEEARVALDRLGSELASTEADERQLRQQRDGLRGGERGISESGL